MNFNDLVHRWLAQVHDFFLAIGEWGRGQIQETIRALSRALFINVAVMFLGLVIEAISFNFDWWNWITSFGHFLVAFAGTLSAGLWLYTWTRIWVLVEASVKANEVAKAVVHEATRPLPSSPIELPMLMDQVLANRILQGVMSGLAAVAFGSMYAGFFPVYTSLTGFFVTITAGFSIAFAMYNPTATGSVTIRKWLIPVAVIVIAINTVLCFFPYDTARFTDLRNAENRSSQPVTDAEASRIEMLQQKRAKIIATANSRGDIQYKDDDQKLLDKLEQQIRDIRYPILQQTEGLLSLSLPRMNKKNQTMILLFAAIGGFVLYFMSRTKKAQ